MLESLTPPAAEAMSDRRPRRHRRLLRLTGNCLLAVWVVAFAAAIFAVASGAWQARTVLTGSMVPKLPVGSVVLTQREPLAALKVGDVVVFHRPDEPAMLVVHRVIALRGTATGTEVHTKGDANAVADPWNPFVLHGPFVYVARHDVPYLGHLVTDARSEGVRLAMYAGAALLAIAAVRYLLRRAPDEDSATDATGSNPSD